MITALDTNILLDILIPNEPHLNSSLKKLDTASSNGKLILCEIVYVELASQFERKSELDDFLIETRIEMIQSNQDSLFQASMLWNKYRHEKEEKIYCPECGSKIDFNCPLCKVKIQRRRVLNDFIIGAHAIQFADRILIRDRGFYRNYFSDLVLMEAI